MPNRAATNGAVEGGAEESEGKAMHSDAAAAAAAADDDDDDDDDSSDPSAAT